MAASREECESLAEAASASGAALGINQNFLFHPAFLALRRAIAEGQRGRLRFVECVYSVPLRQLAAGQLGHWMFAAPANILLEQAVPPAVADRCAARRYRYDGGDAGCTAGPVGRAKLPGRLDDCPPGTAPFRHPAVRRGREFPAVADHGDMRRRYHRCRHSRQPRPHAEADTLRRPDRRCGRAGSLGGRHVGLRHRQLRPLRRLAAGPVEEKRPVFPQHARQYRRLPRRAFAFRGGPSLRHPVGRTVRGNRRPFARRGEPSGAAAGACHAERPSGRRGAGRHRLHRPGHGGAACCRRDSASP